MSINNAQSLNFHMSDVTINRVGYCQFSDCDNCDTYAMANISQEIDDILSLGHVTLKKMISITY